MRTYQLTIVLNNIEDVNNRQELHIYVDGNNIGETICAGFDELLTAMKESNQYFTNVAKKQHRNETYRIGDTYD